MTADDNFPRVDEVFSSQARADRRELRHFSPRLQLVSLIMKSQSLVLLSFAALSASAFAQVPVGPNSIKVGKVEVSAPSSPEYQLTGGPNKRYKTAKWI